MSATTWMIVIAVLVLVAAVTLVALTTLPMRRRPEGDSAIRDQIIAQNRVFAGKPAEAGDPTWDGVERAPIPTQAGGA